MKVLTVPVLPPTSKNSGYCRAAAVLSDVKYGIVYCRESVNSTYGIRVRGCYLVANGSSVPVVGDTLPTVLVLETTRIPGDGEEGFQYVLV